MDTPASLSFEPAHINTTVNSTFPLIVNIFTDTRPAISTDVWISYNPELVEPVLPITSADTFDTVSAKVLSPGRLYLYGLQTDVNTADPANGMIATITFKALKEGTAPFAFECSYTGKTSSQIIENNASLTNIINCDRTAIHTATVTVAEGNVLGIADLKSESMGMWSLTAGIVVLVLTVMLFTKYRTLRQKKKIL